MFRLDVFNNSFEYVSAVMIDDHQSIDLDYLTYSPYTVRCKEIEAQKGFFTHITDEDNNTIADGIIADIKPEQKTQTITIRPLNALFDADVFYTPVSDAISWLASNIQQAFMTNSDTYQNRPINLTYTVASEQLPLTGFNLHETVNILSVMISALKTYGVVVESTLDLVNKRIRVNIFRQEATKTILADLENLISSQVTIGDPFGSTNKATLRKIQVNDDESTTVLGDFNFYLHPDGSIDQSNTNRIQPVFWEMETLQLEDDMTDAQWLAAATARAKEILEPAKFDNEIILRYQQADKLVYPLELPIGAQCEIHLKGEIYASLLTGKALEGKTVTLYFGVVRTDLTKQLSIKNRETFSFESTVNAVMKSVAEKYPTKDSVADVYATKNQLTINNISWDDKWLIPDGTDFNTIHTIGTWYVQTDLSARTMTNIPDGSLANAGTLEVIAPISQEKVGTVISGIYRYIVQVWTSWEGNKWIRRLSTDRTGNWDVGRWKTISNLWRLYQTNNLAQSSNMTYIDLSGLTYNEILIEVGQTNSAQVYGGTNVVIPRGSNHPIFIYWGTGGSAPNQRFYVYLTASDNLLRVRNETFTATTCRYSIWYR